METKQLYDVGSSNPAETVSYTYDALGRRQTIIESRGTTAFSYDSDGRVT